MNVAYILVKTETASSFLMYKFLSYAENQKNQIGTHGKITKNHPGGVRRTNVRLTFIL
jgi:hypothetical protein